MSSVLLLFLFFSHSLSSAILRNLDFIEALFYLNRFYLVLEYFTFLLLPALRIQAREDNELQIRRALLLLSAQSDLNLIST